MFASSTGYEEVYMDVSDLGNEDMGAEPRAKHEGRQRTGSVTCKRQALVCLSEMDGFCSTTPSPRAFCAVSWAGFLCVSA